MWSSGRPFFDGDSESDTFGKIYIVDVAMQS